MKHGTFQKIKSTDDDALGPAAVLLCGFSTDVESRVKKVLENVGAREHRILFCTKAMVKQPLGKALQSEDDSNRAAEPDRLPRTMVLSGMSGSQLKAFLSEFRSCGLPRPIFASVTPHNLEFPVGKLLLELLNEQREMAKRR